MNQKAFILVVGIQLIGSALVGQEPAKVDLKTLRSVVSREILNEESVDLLPLVDHLWKSNGGTLITRDPANPEARALADRFAQQISYDPATDTVSWSVFGFSNTGATRFPPNSLWVFMAPYFMLQQKDENELRTLERNFGDYAMANLTRVDPLTPPSGLTIPADRLRRICGYYGSALFNYSAADSYELAFKCYQLGLLDDAMVLLSHAIAQQENPKFYLLRGTIEMASGRPDDAEISARGFVATMPRTAMGGTYAIERINGPANVQFRHLVAELVRRGTI
jgi:hypothetical protein